MANKLIMKCVGGPYGDCTSAYEFTMPKQMTLKEFAEMVAADKEEWGAIRKGSSFGDVLAEYNRSGEINYRDYADPNAILELKGTAHGGWSLMDYHVNIDKNAELVKPQEQYNKFIEDSEPEHTGGLLGWICPVCGRGLSPYTNSCPCTLNREIACGTGTPVTLDGTITCRDAFEYFNHLENTIEKLQAENSILADIIDEKEEALEANDY